MPEEAAGQWIRDGRQQRGLAQDELATQLGVTSTTISRWERGIAAPRLKQARKLRQLFEMTQEERWERPPPPESRARALSDAKELLDQLHGQTGGHGPYWRAIVLYLESLRRSHQEGVS